MKGFLVGLCAGLSWVAMGANEWHFSGKEDGEGYRVLKQGSWALTVKVEATDLRTGTIELSPRDHEVVGGFDAGGKGTLDLRDMVVSRGSRPLKVVWHLRSGRDRLAAFDGPGSVTNFYINGIGKVSSRHWGFLGGVVPFSTRDAEVGFTEAVEVWPSTYSAWNQSYGLFCNSHEGLTNLVVRAPGLRVCGTGNFGFLPSLRRVVLDMPRVEDLGDGPTTWSRLQSLETVELWTTHLKKVCSHWPSFSPFAEVKAVSKVVCHGKPPEDLLPLRDMLRAVPCVANRSEKGKRCVLLVDRAFERDWRAVASEFELGEEKLAPAGCIGVFTSCSRKAWVVVGENR